MSNIAKPNYQSVAAKTRSKPRMVTGKLKAVLDAVVSEGADPYEAGRAVGMLAVSMRKSLKKPHVLAYLRTARQVLREQARAQNIHHMIEMRRSSTNEMAKLGAMKLLEAVDDTDMPGRGAHAQVAPGLIIQIVNSTVPSQQPPVTIDAGPAVDAPAELRSTPRQR